MTEEQTLEALERAEQAVTRQGELLDRLDAAVDGLIRERDVLLARVAELEAEVARLQKDVDSAWKIASDAIGYVQAADRRQDDTAYLDARMRAICHTLKPQEAFGMDGDPHEGRA